MWDYFTISRIQFFFLAYIIYIKKIIEINRKQLVKANPILHVNSTGWPTGKQLIKERISVKI